MSLCLLWPNGWMDQAGTWHGGMPQPRRFCVRWGPSSLPKRGQSPLPNFPQYCGQTAGCIKMPLGMDVGLCPWNSVLDGDPVPLPKKGRAPKFGGPFWGRGSEVPSNTKLPGPGLAPYQVTSSSIQPFGRNRYGPKIGGAVPLWECRWVPI